VAAMGRQARAQCPGLFCWPATACLPAKHSPAAAGKGSAQCGWSLLGYPAGGRTHPPTQESGILLDSIQLQRGRRLVMHEPKRLAILAARLEAHIRLRRERSGGGSERLAAAAAPVLPFHHCPACCTGCSSTHPTQAPQHPK
jgi:hypothetical protein